ncbi:MAG TPA: FAD:protein FMN transferase [Gaiellaceae bacterium]|nr:FAD:protein FMN transferase [Gaiellaceae bacterium]
MHVATGTFEAIGVTNQVTVVDPRTLEDALAIARADIDALDDAASRFRHDSELARLNAKRHAVVSPLLLDAVETALDAARQTEGLVDPTVGASLHALGYDDDFDVIVRRTPAPTFEVRPATGWRSVQLDRATATIRLRRGTELDLGATAKAFAADRIASRIHAATRTGVLVSLGGDVAVAGPPPPDGWPILVTDDSRREAGFGQVVAIRSGGLATSSTTVRRWRAGGVDVHHIVDPFTGAPAAAVWRTVSVAAPTCTAANTAATAAIVRGTDAARWLEERGLAARLVAPDGAVVRTGGWPRDLS